MENAGAPLPLELEVLSGPAAGAVLAPRPGAGALVRLGRTRAAGLQVRDPSVSERHAELSWDAAARAWAVRDVGSSNGTSLNGAPLAPRAPPARLKTGDVLLLGADTTARVRVGAAAAAAAPAAARAPAAAPVEPPPADPTVEEFLEAECRALEAAVRARAEALKAGLWAQWGGAKAALLAEGRAAAGAGAGRA